MAGGLALRRYRVERIRLDIVLCSENDIWGKPPFYDPGNDHIRVISAVWVISEGGGVSLFLTASKSQFKKVDLIPEATETNDHEE